jgi:hypothetical protein
VHWEGKDSGVGAEGCGVMQAGSGMFMAYSRHRYMVAEMSMDTDLPKKNKKRNTLTTVPQHTHVVLYATRPLSSYQLSISDNVKYILPTPTTIVI